MSKLKRTDPVRASPRFLMVGREARRYTLAMPRTYTRREILQRSGQWAVVGAVGSSLSFAADAPPPVSPGLVAGQPNAAEAGNKVLRAGGNAIDAAVAAALTAAVAAPLSCGIGGYGGHMVIAREGGRKITAIDFNS